MQAAHLIAWPRAARPLDWCFNELAVEHLAETPRDHILDLGQFDRAAKQPGKGRNASITYPTWDDQVKMGEISHDIESEAVTGDPP
jgi:hypothetical protein